MSLRERPIVPRVFGAINRVFLVIEAKISQDLRLRRVLSANSGPAVNHAVRLIEIHGARNVGRDLAIIHAKPPDAVHLNGKENGNPPLVEFARKLNHGRATPAMAIKNNAHLAFFVVGEQTGAVRAQLCENRVHSFLPAAILERFDVYAAGEFGAKMLGELDFAAEGVVVLDDASDKTQDDDGRLCEFERNRRDGRPVVARMTGREQAAVLNANKASGRRGAGER